jgi:site-specific recombinase XerD
MSNAELIANLRQELTALEYTPVGVGNYCAYARHFLDYLTSRQIALAAVTPGLVARYLDEDKAARERRRGGELGAKWQSIPRAGIHALLRQTLGQWPPKPEIIEPEAILREGICGSYETWLREEKGLANPSISALLWEGRHFLEWQLGRCGVDGLARLSIADIDRYMDGRAPGLRRRSMKDVAERLRSMLRYLHRIGHVPIDLAPRVVGPLLYAYENVPSILEREQIAAVLETTKADRSPMGLRDYAMLQLLATYGLRSGEIRRLKLDDIDWRGEILRVQHTKTGACSVLPLMPSVGEALLDYLRHGRPRVALREIFIRVRAPYRPLRNIHAEILRRMWAAGVYPAGKCGPHIFRHARAVELLRGAVSQKMIGDLLGHRSTEATIPYLKLATEDLRAIALDVPGREALS